MSSLCLENEDFGARYVVEHTDEGMAAWLFFGFFFEKDCVMSSRIFILALFID